MGEQDNHRRILVIGAGAAGLMAAVAAGDAGAEVTVLEKNEKAGKKIYITGKGRCNFTNACEDQDFFDHVVTNPKFLYSAIYDYDAAAVTRFMEDNGCPTKVERGLRAFPVSDHASDITKALTDHLRQHHVRILYHTTVKRILTQEPAADPGTMYANRETAESRKMAVARPETGGKEKIVKTGREMAESGKTSAARKVTGVELSDGRRMAADAVILATGGRSYPSTGSTGDGYRFAGELGLEVKPQSPALVPFVVKEAWPMTLQGLSLKNVSVSLVPNPAAAGADGIPQEQNAQERRRHPARHAGRPVYEGFGEMMFTHFGITGPLILSASSYTDFVKYPAGYTLHLDLKPALRQEELEARIHREFDAAKKREFSNAIRPLFPERLAGVVARLFAAAQIRKRRGQEQRSAADGADAPAAADAEARAQEMEETARFLKRAAYTFQDREIQDLAALIKDITMTVTGTRGFEEAIITRGGISVKEINPSTMETRKVSGLYIAGEVIDVNAQTGGYNLQIAWSTGHLAGASAAAESGE